MRLRSCICDLLKQSEVCNLALAKKSLYQLVRPILYRHPSITTYPSLILFSRTISQATYMGKVDRKWSEQESLDQSRTLNLTLDPTKNNGQPLPAVMISRTIQAIVRRCPRLAITLCFAHCRCRLSPVAALETETFPGVTRLILYVGKKDPEDIPINDREVKTCQPNARFWRPFVNGMTFPDCTSLEIRHYWATTPPCDANLDLMKQFPARDIYSRNALAVRGSYGRQALFTESIGSPDGLRKFESITLECPPEINSPLLMQLLGNPNAVASNLTSLELRFCNLSYETYSLLLYHAPPNIRRLVLLCCYKQDVRYHEADPEEIPHLCPLVRKFSRNLVHLEYGASTVCRELFLDEVEMHALEHNGIETGLGTDGGAGDKDFAKLDGHAIRETVQDCRKQKRMKCRNDRVKQAMDAAKSSASSDSISRSLFGGNNASTANQNAAKAQRDTEALLDEEEGRRTRLVEGSKTPWFRRIVAYRGLCNLTDTWEEIQIAAEMEEKGIEWVLASKSTLSLGVFFIHV